MTAIKDYHGVNVTPKSYASKSPTLTRASMNLALNADPTVIAEVARSLGLGATVVLGLGASVSIHANHLPTDEWLEKLRQLFSEFPQSLPLVPEEPQ